MVWLSTVQVFMIPYLCGALDFHPHSPVVYHTISYNTAYTIICNTITYWWRSSFTLAMFCSNCTLYTCFSVITTFLCKMWSIVAKQTVLIFQKYSIILNDFILCLYVFQADRICVFKAHIYKGSLLASCGSCLSAASIWSFLNPTVQCKVKTTFPTVLVRLNANTMPKQAVCTAFHVCRTVYYYWFIALWLH